MSIIKNLVRPILLHPSIFRMVKKLVFNHSKIENLSSAFWARKKEFTDTLSPLEKDFLDIFFRDYLNDSYKSQLGQDIFADFYNKRKSNGFFIEIGVGNGMALSNTYFLEKNRNWNGILCEPDSRFHSTIFKEREVPLCKDPIYKTSGLELKFLEVGSEGEYSTLDIYRSSDHHEKYRVGEHKRVKTLSFGDMASQYNVPTTIDYVSIDTEGSEYDILSSIDLQKYDITIFTIEHNYDMEKLKLIRNYLKPYNYIEINSVFSLWDIWFYKKSL